MPKLSKNYERSSNSIFFHARINAGNPAIFFREVYKLRQNAYIYEPLWAAIAGANDHMGLAGPTSSNR